MKVRREGMRPLALLAAAAVLAVPLVAAEAASSREYVGGHGVGVLCATRQGAPMDVGGVCDLPAPGSVARRLTVVDDLVAPRYQFQVEDHDGRVCAAGPAARSDVDLAFLGLQDGCRFVTVIVSAAMQHGVVTVE